MVAVFIYVAGMRYPLGLWKWYLDWKLRRPGGEDTIELNMFRRNVKKGQEYVAWETTEYGVNNEGWLLWREQEWAAS